MMSKPRLEGVDSSIYRPSGPLPPPTALSGSDGMA